MKARNMVIAGDYKGKHVRQKSKFNEPLGKEAAEILLDTKWISIFHFEEEQIFLTPETVESYEVLLQEILGSRVSGGSFGDMFETFSGTVVANAIYTISIQFKDGKKSVIEIDGKLYRYFLRGMKLWDIE